MFDTHFLFFNTSLNSQENKILVKIENQIITSLDVNNEYKYLVALNPSIKNSKKRRYHQTFKKVHYTRKNKKNRNRKKF